MGHKLHLDQNEKLVMFGVTHVVAIDGFSSQTVAHNTMPVKNNLTIYQKVYRLIHAPLTFILCVSVLNQWFSIPDLSEHITALFRCHRLETFLTP